MSRLRVDGKTREDIVDLAIKERRANVYTPAPDLSTDFTEDHVIYPKSDRDRATILAALHDNYVFSSLKASDCAGIVDYMEPEQVDAGTDIIVQGDPAMYFYIIQTGSFTVLQGAKKVGALTVGQSFGETGLLYNSPRNATIRALEDSRVWKLNRHTFRRLLATAATSHQLDVVACLKSADILKGLSDRTLTELAMCAVEVEYEKGQTIVTKGEIGALGYFILQGTVRVTDLPPHIPDVVYGPGQHFGLQALWTGETRNATVVADTDVMVAALSQHDIDEILGPMTELFRHDHQTKELGSIPLLAEFSSAMISSLLQAMQVKHFVAGDSIIKQGDIGTTFYLIQTGACTVVHRDDEGVETEVKKLTALQYFGEMALLRDEPRSASVTAVTDCTVLEMEQATFQRMFGSSVHFSKQLEQVVKGRRRSLQRIQHPVEHITMEELQTIKVLGSGTFGVVTLVQHVKQEEPCFYALKAMSIEFIERHKQEGNIVGEKLTMLDCDHPVRFFVSSSRSEHERKKCSLPHLSPLTVLGFTDAFLLLVSLHFSFNSTPRHIQFILKLYSTMRDSYRIFFLMEYCDGGELFNVLHNKDRDFVPEHQVRCVVALLLSSVCALLSKASAAYVSHVITTLDTYNILLYDRPSFTPPAKSSPWSIWR
jgi:CRP-like cAMP-binding protein